MCRVMVYNNYIIIGFCFVGWLGLNVILSLVIVMGMARDCLALTDFYKLWRGGIWPNGENFVPLHCQQRGRLRAAVKEKNSEH